MQDLAGRNLACLERVQLTAAGWSAVKLGALLGQNLELQCVTVSAHLPYAASNRAQAPVAACRLAALNKDGPNC